MKPILKGLYQKALLSLKAYMRSNYSTTNSFGNLRYSYLFELRQVKLTPSSYVYKKKRVNEIRDFGELIVGFDGEVRGGVGREE